MPAAFANYFLGSTGASAALIGLLFVAITVAPERVFGQEATAQGRALAGSAFTALLNDFFVSLTALIPDTNVGYVALVMACISLLNTLSLARHFLEARGVRAVLEGLTLLLGSLAIYGLELWYALPLLNQPHNAEAVRNLAYLLLATYAVGVGRAWELLGAQDEGLLTLLGLRHR